MAIKIGTVTVAPDEAPSDGITYGRKDGEWVDLTAPANLQVRRGTLSEIQGIVPLEGEPVWATDENALFIGNGSALGGVEIGGLTNTGNYIVCKPGDSFAAKYARAKLLTPNGSALSATNRAKLIVLPGYYSLASQCDIDANFVDIIGLGSMATSVGPMPTTSSTEACVCAVVLTTSAINVSATDIWIKGIEAAAGFRVTGVPATTITQIFEQCVGGGTGVTGATVNGTYINCRGNMFGAGQGIICSGRFYNCAATSFSGNGSASVASGLFVNCRSNGFCFAGLGGTASGTFVNCAVTGSQPGFGSAGGTASGLFVNCSGPAGSFGGSGTASGRFFYCRLTTAGPFQAPTGNGVYRYCLDGADNAYSAP